jgi:hypothetical protein
VPALYSSAPCRCSRSWVREWRRPVPRSGNSRVVIAVAFSCESAPRIAAIIEIRCLTKSAVSGCR